MKLSPQQDLPFGGEIATILHCSGGAEFLRLCDRAKAGELRIVAWETGRTGPASYDVEVWPGKTSDGVDNR